MKKKNFICTHFFDNKNSYIPIGRCGYNVVSIANQILKLGQALFNEIHKDLEGHIHYD